MAKKTPDVVGSIAANELYTLDALEARWGSELGLRGKCGGVG